MIPRKPERHPVGAERAGPQQSSIPRPVYAEDFSLLILRTRSVRRVRSRISVLN